MRKPAPTSRPRWPLVGRARWSSANSIRARRLGQQPGDRGDIALARYRRSVAPGSFSLDRTNARSRPGQESLNVCVARQAFQVDRHAAADALGKLDRRAQRSSQQ